MNKKLFKIDAGLMCACFVCNNRPLPAFTSVKSLCDHFSKYFVDKIETIRSKFPDKVHNIPSVQKQKLDPK